MTSRTFQGVFCLVIGCLYTFMAYCTTDDSVASHSFATRSAVWTAAAIVVLA